MKKRLFSAFQGIAKGDIPPTGLIMLVVTYVRFFLPRQKQRKEKTLGTVEIPRVFWHAVRDSNS